VIVEYVKNSYYNGLMNVIANDHGLYVNLNETKIVVFRSRGNVKPEERW
jgi:hypothetical protein